jgi:putative aldouronate transport system permease protein
VEGGCVITNQNGLARPKAAGMSRYFKRTWMIYLMLLLPMLFFLIFRYVPMTNIIIAFKDYNIFRGVWTSPWAQNPPNSGEVSIFKWFAQAFTNRDFYTVLRNTIMLNVLDLLFGFPMPIILAILLNELPFRYYKKFTQTVIYLPHFLSWIIISGITVQLFAPGSGIINMALGKMGLGPIDFLMDKNLWVGTYVGLGVWKEMGWGTIIYLASITGINP